MEPAKETKKHAAVLGEAWLKARLELLDAEKELTRHSDAVAKMRQDLPWEPVGKDHRFNTENGVMSLAELFEGRSELIIYHFMYGPEKPLRFL